MQHHVDPLAPERIQNFIGTLAGLPPEEIRKAKILFIRNAISEYRAMTEAHVGFEKLQGCMSFIPIFWPVLGVQKRMMAAQRRLMRERIQNAIDVWRDDLQGERFDLDDERGGF